MNLIDFLADACRAQAEQYRAEQIALGMRNLKQLAESVAVPVEHEVNPTELKGAA